MDTTYSVVIHRSARDVFEYVTDPANIASWAWYIDEVWVHPAGQLQVGSQIHQTVRGREAVWNVTAYEPDSLCAYQADYWYATGSVKYLVEDLGDRARFTIHDKAHRKGPIRLLGPLLDRIDAHYRRVQMRLVKEALEKGAGADPSD